MRQRSPAWLQGPEVALSRRHILYRFVISRRSSGRVLRATRLVERWQVEGSCPAPRVRQSRRRRSLWYVWPICEPDPPVLSLLSLSWLWLIDVSMRPGAQLSCRTSKLPLTRDHLTSPHFIIEWKEVANHGYSSTPSSFDFSQSSPIVFGMMRGTIAVESICWITQSYA